MLEALEVTEDNLAYIIEYGKTLSYKLDHIEFDIRYNKSQNWKTYLIIAGFKKIGDVYFTAISEPVFRLHWKFKTAEIPDHFVEIKRV